MKRYLTTKSSINDWLVDIPEGWQVKRLKYITYTRVSNVDKKSEDEIAVKLCNYTDVYKNEFITVKINFMLATATRRQVDAFELKKGDVILTKDSESSDDIGIPAYVDLEDTKNIVCGYHLAISTPIRSLLLGKYLFRLFQSNIFRSYFEISSKGITRYGLDTYSIYNANIPLPSLPEQCMIADFLDRETGKIDRLISRKQKLMALLKEERIAIINQVVTKGIDPNIEMKDSGIEWIGEIPKHWEIKRIKRIAQVKRGASPRPIDDPKYFNENGEFGWVRIADVSASTKYLEGTEQKLSNLGASLSVKQNPGDIFISIAGTVGKPIISKIKCCIHDGFVWFPNLAIDKEFLYYIFTGGEVYKGLGKLGTQLNLNTDTIGQIFIAIPPEEEIKKIIEYIKVYENKTNLMIRNAQKEINLLQEYRTALISEVVTGKIDVREEVVSWT